MSNRSLSKVLRSNGSHVNMQEEREREREREREEERGGERRREGEREGVRERDDTCVYTPTYNIIIIILLLCVCVRVQWSHVFLKGAGVVHSVHSSGVCPEHYNPPTCAISFQQQCQQQNKLA